MKLIKHMLKNKRLSIQELQKIIKKNDIKLDDGWPQVRIGIGDDV